MRILFILTLFLTYGCATSGPERSIASETELRYGVIDFKKSLIQIFPAVAEQEGLRYYFYLQLKNQSGEFVDCDPADLTLKTKRGKKVPFKYERLLTGRYYLTILKTPQISSAEMNFFIQGRPLKEQFKLHFQEVSRAHTKLYVLKNTRNKIKFRLRLADRLNQPVEIPDQPEIILDGQGQIDDVKHVDEGTWEFSVIYPDQNQIMYFSLRAHGTYFDRIFRYQHVEK
jgi:hypothetical protein